MSWIPSVFDGTFLFQGFYYAYDYSKNKSLMGRKRVLLTITCPWSSGSLLRERVNEYEAWLIKEERVRIKDEIGSEMRAVKPCMA